ncbi:ribose-phosphate diphosphokinase [Candidatus Hecatella orcuttiae]|jgi:ribose-phosphate pyrophosphokinase|uniref:ribose-phosphate diphosphokinase n=1 Tax=Candidatus Hecatella orcuttiae TaxID=1935119 RepID=UPI0028681042|nr:ribose-phosphate diphosphokinase [Candidatus Hecatella orcuttiae]
MLIVSGPSSRSLGERIAQLLGVRNVEVESKVFPDGESYVGLRNDVKGEKVAVIQSTYPPQDTHLMQLYFLLQAVGRLGAEEVTAVTPYLAYARQDKAFKPYEAVSIKAVIRCLEALGIRRLITVDVHEPSIFEDAAFAFQNLSAAKALAEYFLKLNLGELWAFAPDVKATKMAGEAGVIFRTPHGWFRKERDRDTGEIALKSIGGIEVKGKTLILFDDIISSGGTTAAAAKRLKALGAEKVYAACTHPLLMGEALRKVLQSGIEELVGTDTVPSPVSKVSVAPLIAQALKSEPET